VLSTEFSGRRSHPPSVTSVPCFLHCDFFSHTSQGIRAPEDDNGLRSVAPYESHCRVGWRYPVKNSGPRFASDYG
jgi:hypothetical protein